MGKRLDRDRPPVRIGEEELAESDQQRPVRQDRTATGLVEPVSQAESVAVALDESVPPWRPEEGDAVREPFVRAEGGVSFVSGSGADRRERTGARGSYIGS